MSMQKCPEKFRVTLEANDRLDAGDLESLPATRLLAVHHVVGPDHVGSGLGELGSILGGSARRKGTLLGPDDPAEWVGKSFPAEGTVKLRRLLFGFFGVEVPLFHGLEGSGSHSPGQSLPPGGCPRQGSAPPEGTVPREAKNSRNIQAMRSAAARSVTAKTAIARGCRATAAFPDTSASAASLSRWRFRTISARVTRSPPRAQPR